MCALMDDIRFERRLDKKLSKLALTCVASAVPSIDSDKRWLLQRQLLQHATKLEQYNMSGMVVLTRTEWTLHELGVLYADQSKLVEAEKMYE